MIRSIRNVGRLLGITRILARNDALFILEKMEVAPIALTLARLTARRSREAGRPGERLARALQDAGPSFIKLGQALSTRSDLLGEQMTADLSKLQDRLPAFSGTVARSIVAQEFGCPVEELFAEFDDQAVAAASIAQVHFAITLDGREVAVKVLRPDIEQAFARDLDIFRWLAGLIEATRPSLRRLRPVAAVETLAETVEMEMDLRFEAAAAAEMAENFAGDPTYVIPAIDWARTGRRVMTTERVLGIPMDDREAIIEAGHDPQEVMEKAAVAFFNQVFRDGFFHGDLHPGNWFVRQDGAIAAVDFGIMGRLDTTTRRHLAEMLTGFLTRNFRRAAEVHFEAGWVPADQNIDFFTQACRSIAEPILDKPQNEISVARLLGQLFKVTETFEMETQPQLLLLQKTMLVAEGTGRHLAPEANMWMLSRPLMEEWARANLGPEARIRDAATGLAATIERLPKMIGDLERGAGALAGGQIRLHPDTVRAIRGRRAGDYAISMGRVWQAAAWLAVGAGLALILVS